MSNDLKVGEAAEVVRWCCADGACTVGALVVVRAIDQRFSQCECCGELFAGPSAFIESDNGTEGACPLAWLRRPPQLPDAEGLPRDDFAPADPKGWELTTWHPSKTQVPA